MYVIDLVASPVIPKNPIESRGISQRVRIIGCFQTMLIIESDVNNWRDWSFSPPPKVVIIRCHSNTSEVKMGETKIYNRFMYIYIYILTD